MKTNDADLADRLPAGVRLRTPTAADTPAIAALLNARRRAEGQREEYDADGIAAAWKSPGFDPAVDCVVAEAADEGIVGYDVAIDQGSHRVFDCLGGAVRPDAQGRGIEETLLAWAERRVRELVPRAPAGTAVRLCAGKWAVGNESEIAVLERAGFRHLRTFVRMRTDLADPVPEPAWPEDVSVEALRIGDEADERAFWEARTATFADHWGAIPPDAELGLARFRHEVRGSDFDPSLFVAARARSAVVGICFCHPALHGDETTGYVGHVGVVPQWRRRGLARALLRHGLATLRERGKTAAGLGVDADHPTGAIRLYREEGFREWDRVLLFGKVIRPGVDGFGVTGSETAAAAETVARVEGEAS